MRSASTIKTVLGQVGTGLRRSLTRDSLCTLDLLLVLTSNPLTSLFRSFGARVRDVYAWLLQTFQDGDRIFIFGASVSWFHNGDAHITRIKGFSRGAYQARTLAAMIGKVDLWILVSTLS